MVMTI